MEAASKILNMSGNQAMSKKGGPGNPVMEKALRLSAEKGNLEEVKILMKSGAIITKDQVRLIILLCFINNYYHFRMA